MATPARALCGEQGPTWKDWQEFIWLLDRDSVLWIRFCSTRKWMSSTLKERPWGMRAGGHWLA